MYHSDYIGLYVHIPFCKDRCNYCDFVSYTDLSLVEDYFESLLKEITIWSQYVGKVSLNSIYVGGGTPSDIPLKYLEKTFDTISKSFNLCDPEITVEINPKFRYFYELRNLGVNRISMGLQAADDTVLKAVNRRHSVSEFRETCREAMNYFENINIDFIIGLPFESEQTIWNNLKVINEYNPKHVSVYILESKQEFLDQDTLADHHESFISALLENGYERYEISNFAYPGYQCKHNLKYWNNEDYIGIGVSAGGHIGLKRYVNSSNILLYMECLKNGKFAFEYFKENSPLDELKETLFMGLRLSNGIKIDKLMQLSPELKIDELTSILNGYLIYDQESLRLSSTGKDFSKFVLSKIIDENILLHVIGR
ncbi:radical SAM family heme chaperone HemW [Pseudothermotoga elfii]|uniref:radical SAM family heme chaperone HemW n=2 Tax=Pseudothermotoga TaxID=1643951 RepID=UPI0003FB9D69|nr:radical SAM family heme chaperone HemW [Pseudothermotoga elfii]